MTDMLPEPYQAPPPPQVVAARSPGVSVLASFFIPGLGSMIAGRVGKGVAILCAHIVAVALCWVLIGFALAPAVWIYSMVAGASDARKWNAQHGIVS
jgi:TM2 domain-containing membrane protein YozV